MRIFIHPTLECNLHCPGCYLTDKPLIEEMKQHQMQPEYWERVLEYAHYYGFTELALPINPHKGAAEEMKYWSRDAKLLGFKLVNVTTTRHLVTKENLEAGVFDDVDILSISVDEHRFKNTKQVLKLLYDDIKLIRQYKPEIQINCNLTYTPVVFDWVKQPGFFKGLTVIFDMVSHLFLKPTSECYPSDEWFMTNFADLFYNYPDLHMMGNGTNILGDYCMAHRMGTNQCESGVKEISLDPLGQLSICPFSPAHYDASTVGKFRDYLDEMTANAEYIGDCNLIGVNA